MRPLRRWMVLGGVGLAAVAGVGGTALAAGSGSPNSFLNDFARRLGISPAKVQTAYQQALVDRLNAMVKSGRLTQAQAKAIEARIKAGGANGLGGPFRGSLGERARRFGFEFRRPMLGRRDMLAAVATYLGVTESTLRSDLRSGTALAKVAAAGKGKSVTGLEAAMLAPVRAKLDKAVTAKSLTAGQETEMLSRTSQMIQAIVTNGFGMHGRRDGSHPDSDSTPGTASPNQAPSAQSGGAVVSPWGA